MERRLSLRQTAEKIGPELFQKLLRPKSYPSHRDCPACGEKTFYLASWGTLFTGLYTRTCSSCGYCDSRKVKMIKQL